VIDGMISVIIPVYNCRRYLADAIESVLAQTHPAGEVVVVDDGSTDGSEDVARSYGSAVRCYLQPNRGISAARNHGIAAARGEFFAFLDADDVWTKDKLQLQLAAFHAHPELDVAFGHIRQIHGTELNGASGETKATGTQRVRAESPEGIPALDVVPGYLPSTLMIRRESFGQVGAFDTRWRVGEFADWYLRATELHLRMAMLPDLLALRRVHDTNNWRRQREARTDYVRVLKASLDRRRASPRVQNLSPRPGEPG